MCGSLDGYYSVDLEGEVTGQIWHNIWNMVVFDNALFHIVLSKFWGFLSIFNQ